MSKCPDCRKSVGEIGGKTRGLYYEFHIGKIREGFRIGTSISYLPIMLTDAQLAEYQAIRANEGLHEISNQDALVEASALVNLIKITIGMK